MPLTGYALSCAIEVRELSSASSWKAAEWVSPVKTTAACGHSLLAGFLQSMPKAWWGVLNWLVKLLFVTNWVNCPQTEEWVCSIKMRYHGTTWTTCQCAVQATWNNAKVINVLYEVCVRLAELLIANPETWRKVGPLWRLKSHELLPCLAFEFCRGSAAACWACSSRSLCGVAPSLIKFDTVKIRWWD